MNSPLRFIAVAKIVGNLVLIPELKHYHCQNVGVTGVRSYRCALLRRCKDKMIPLSAKYCRNVHNPLHREIHLDAVPDNVEILSRDTYYAVVALHF